jgi:hypothetical protein
MVFKFQVCLVKEKINKKFRFASLKTLTNCQDCSESRTKFLSTFLVSHWSIFFCVYNHGWLSKSHRQPCISKPEQASWKWKDFTSNKWFQRSKQNRYFDVLSKKVAKMCKPSALLKSTLFIFRPPPIYSFYQAHISIVNTSSMLLYSTVSLWSYLQYALTKNHYNVMLFYAKILRYRLENVFLLWCMYSLSRKKRVICDANHMKNIINRLYVDS